MRASSRAADYFELIAKRLRQFYVTDQSVMSYQCMVYTKDTIKCASIPKRLNTNLGTGSENGSLNLIFITFLIFVYFSTGDKLVLMQYDVICAIVVKVLDDSETLRLSNPKTSDCEIWSISTV